MGLSSQEIEKANQIKQGMVKKNAHKLIQKYGFDAEKRITGRAINMAKKLAEQDMEQNKLREMVKAALMKPMDEKMDPVGREDADINNDGKVDKTDKYLASRRDAIAKNMKNEDLDLGHEDNEPHMIKAELYRIGKYAMELYGMVEEFEEMGGEVDFPAWWQAKITTAMNNMVSAKHYLDFEVKEPAIDAAVDAMTGEDIIPNTPTEPLEDEIKEIGMFHDPKGYEKPKPDPKGKIYTKEFKGQGVYDIFKNGEKIKTITGGEGKANAYINKLKRELEEGLPKDYWAKKIPGGKMDESYEALVKKIKGQGKSEKAAKAIAGAVASYKAKGGGKGPTAKQKARG
jgi:hypothetical protein